MALIGKFAYKVNGRKGVGRLVIMDVSRGTNSTRVDLDFGDDEQALKESEQYLRTMEREVFRLLPQNPTSLLVLSKPWVRAVLLAGCSFDGNLLPDRERLEKKDADIIFQQLRRFIDVKLLKPLETYPTL